MQHFMHSSCQHAEVMFSMLQPEQAASRELSMVTRVLGTGRCALPTMHLIQLCPSPSWQEDGGPAAAHDAAG